MQPWPARRQRTRPACCGAPPPWPHCIPVRKRQRLARLAGETVQVSIDNFSYVPKQLTVKAGTTVVWTNKDDTPHTVTSNDKIFSSALIDTNEKFQYTFAKPGNYPYFCKVHPMMTGKVVVQ